MDEQPDLQGEVAELVELVGKFIETVERLLAGKCRKMEARD